MKVDNKRVLDWIERKDKIRKYLIRVILCLIAILLIITNYFFQEKSERQLLSGVVSSVKYYQKRGGSFFQCGIVLGNTEKVEAECFGECVVGSVVKLNKIIRPFDIVNYKVLYCRSDKPNS